MVLISVAFFEFGRSRAEVFPSKPTVEPWKQPCRCHDKTNPWPEWELKVLSEDKTINGFSLRHRNLSSKSMAVMSSGGQSISVFRHVFEANQRYEVCVAELTEDRRDMPMVKRLPGELMTETTFLWTGSGDVEPGDYVVRMVGYLGQWVENPAVEVHFRVK
jgi:hypothetical protein